MTQKTASSPDLTGRCLRYGILFLIVLIPFHASLSVWLASAGLNYEAVRLWKEALLLVLIILAGVTLWKDRMLLKDLSQDWIVRLTVLLISFVALSAVILLLTGNVAPKAVGYGLIVDTRLWVFLLIVLIAIKSKLHLAIPAYVVWPAIIVIGFGLLQMSLLPNDVLRHIGYNSDTILPFQAVDNNPDFPRIQATMRGANPLGAYLVPVVMLLAAGWIKFRSYRMQFSVAIIAALTVLFGTHSRSAWLGMVLAAGLFVVWRLQGKARRIVLLAAAALLVFGALGVYVLRENDFVQNTVFHSSEESPSVVSSNEQRSKALRTGLEDIAGQPLGGGVGSAGPASVYNGQKGRLAENYFIQFGQELGVLGLGLLVTLIGLICRRLYMLRGRAVPLAVLTSLAGLILINMLSHAWADDTLAYITGAVLAYGLYAYSNSTKSESLQYNKGK